MLMIIWKKPEPKKIWLIRLFLKLLLPLPMLYLFAVTPSPSVASTGPPTGNNPSGSAVLPQPASTTVPATPDSVVVGDINNYITKTYGANVDPRKLAGLTTLFPISLISGRPYGLTGS